VFFINEELNICFYATEEDITHLTNRCWFSDALALWYGLEIYPPNQTNPTQHLADFVPGPFRILELAPFSDLAG